MSAKITAEAVRAAIFDRFLDTGKPVTRAEIADVLGCATSAVSKVIADHNGSVPGAVYSEVYRPRMSKAYPGLEVGGSVRVDAWEPSMESMRQALLRNIRTVQA